MANRGHFYYSAILKAYAGERDGIIKYKDFLIPRLPILVGKCRSSISKRDSLREGEDQYAKFLEILYRSILLFYALNEPLDLDLLEIQALFGPSFDLMGDLKIQARTKGFSVGETFMTYIERSTFRQQSITSIFKFQQVKPQLAYIIERFEQERKIEEARTHELRACVMVVYYLDYYINRDYRSGLVYDD